MTQPAPPNQPPSSGSEPVRSWLSNPESAPSTPTPSGTVPPPQPPSTPTQPKPQQHATISEALSSIKPSDFSNVTQIPCSQQGYLTGIGSGIAMGVLRWIMGVRPQKAAHWAVGMGVLGATAQWEYCRFQRRQEREKMVRMVEVYSARQAREKAEAEERAKEARERKEKEKEEKRSWWRAW
ncbi:hypothetical protein OQA88_9922 [Cercophora sp. LCS_1]